MNNWVMSQLCVKGKTKNKITFQEMTVFSVLIGITIFCLHIINKFVITLVCKVTECDYLLYAQF